MDNSTKKLLEECSVGCKMGIESMEQVQHHVTDAGIAGVIEKYCSRHKELEAEVSKMFLRAGQPEKEPGVMVSTFSWMTTGVKMVTGEDENKQAPLLIMKRSRPSIFGFSGFTFMTRIYNAVNTFKDERSPPI